MGGYIVFRLEDIYSYIYVITISVIVFNCLCLSPGKVHGSLARAGKVRGQTPKVAKQDKKKKPRGRAHKRMQYNRRFVTAGDFPFSLFHLQCHNTNIFTLLRCLICCGALIYRFFLGFILCRGLK